MRCPCHTGVVVDRVENINAIFPLRANDQIVHEKTNTLNHMTIPTEAVA